MVSSRESAPSPVQNIVPSENGAFSSFSYNSGGSDRQNGQGSVFGMVVANASGGA